MFINDEYIKQIFLTKSGGMNRPAVQRMTEDALPYLLNRYNDSDSINETILRIRDNIEIHPHCKTCGKRLEFKYVRGHIKEYCSSKCAHNNDNVKEKMQKTCLERYGVINGGCSEQALLKIKKTTLKHYGVECLWQSEKVKEKIRKTNNKKLGVDYPMQSEKVKEKSKQTCLLKYNCEYTGQAEIKKLHSKETFLKNYGVDHNWKNKDVIKQCITNRFANRLNTNDITSSKEENICYDILKGKFNVIHRQKRDEHKYPFFCDFYIEDIDTWIEFNGFMTHGNHPFDANNVDDINKLNELKIRNITHNSPNNNLYESTIYTWTIKDPMKRMIAKKNKLKYFEFFTIEDLNTWVKNYGNI